MDIAAWLRDLGLERYEQAFHDNAITGETLPELAEADLERLGVLLGHRKRLLKAITALRDPSTTNAEPPAAGLVGELRQATILFADLSGFTKLGSVLDAEDLHALIDRFFDVTDGVVEGYGGTIDKHVGDAVMAVFGAPLAHGNDPERAVRAAIAIHPAVAGLSEAVGRELRVHIGVATGRVVASAAGSPRHRHYTVTGESVNLASRLTGLAKPGETLISDAVHRAVEWTTACEPVGDLAVKGLDTPIRAWRVAAIRSKPLKAPDRPFVGRQTELRRFAAVLDGCRVLGKGGTVYLRGHAGMGKTRLVEEVRELAGHRGFNCHTGLILDFGVGAGQDAVSTLVGSLLHVQTGAFEADRWAAADRAIADSLVEAPQRAFLNDLLDLPQPNEMRALLDAMDDTTRNRGMQTTLASLVRRVSARQLLLLVIEDLHWADPLTLGQVSAVAKAVAESAAVLVMTSRIEGDPLDRAWWEAIEGRSVTIVNLPPLRKSEAVALAGAYRSETDRFARKCVERADGNPLFLDQLLRSAEGNGRDDDTGIPASIHSLVLARMDRLPSQDKRAVQAASVIGQRFSLGVLRAVLADPAYFCDGLLVHYLVQPEGEDFLFVHALIREGIYLSLTKASRRTLHRHAADWYVSRDPSLRAEHLGRADDPAAPQAYCEAAAKQAAAFRYEAALGLIGRGLALAVTTADRYALSTQQGKLLRESGWARESLDAYREALGCANSEVDQCRALIGSAASHRRLGGYEDAMAALDLAEPIAHRHGLDRECSQVHYYRGSLYYPRGNLVGCLEEQNLALAFAELAQDREWEALALSGLGDAHHGRGRIRTAFSCFRRCVELCDTNGLGRIAPANRMMLGYTRIYLNQLAAALEGTFQAIDTAVQVGNRFAEMLARHLAGFVLYLRGDYAASAKYNLKALSMARTLGARQFEASIVSLQAGTLIARDRRAEAFAAAEQAMIICRETDIGFFGPEVLSLMARATDDTGVRERALAEGEEILRRDSVGTNYFWFSLHAIDTALEQRDWRAVDRYTSALADFTRPEPLPLSDLLIARGRALASHGQRRHDAGVISELQRLRDEAEECGLRLVLPALEAALAERAAG